MKMNACTTTGIAWPMLRVPGIFSSGTMRRSLKTDVVGANDPIPSVSKKFVTAPTTISKSVGRTRPPSRPRRRASANQ